LNQLVIVDRLTFFQQNTLVKRGKRLFTHDFLDISDLELDI